MNNYIKKFFDGISETREMAVFCLAVCCGIIFGFTIWWIIVTGVVLLLVLVQHKKIYTKFAEVSQIIGIIFMAFSAFVLGYVVINWLGNQSFFQSFVSSINSIHYWWIVLLLFVLFVFANMPIVQTERKINGWVNENYSRDILNAWRYRRSGNCKFSKAYDINLHKALQNVKFDEISSLRDVMYSEQDPVLEALYQKYLVEEINQVKQRLVYQHPNSSTVCEAIVKFVKQETWGDMYSMRDVLKWTERYYTVGDEEGRKLKVNTMGMIISLLLENESLFELVKNELAKTSVGTKYYVSADDLYDLLKLFAAKEDQRYFTFLKQVDDAIRVEFYRCIENGNVDLVYTLVKPNLDALQGVNKKRLLESQQIQWLDNVPQFSQLVQVSNEKEQLFYNQHVILKYLTALAGLKKYSHYDAVLRKLPQVFHDFIVEFAKYPNYLGVKELKKILDNAKKDFK